MKSNLHFQDNEGYAKFQDQEYKQNLPKRIKKTKSSTLLRYKIYKTPEKKENSANLIKKVKRKNVQKTENIPNNFPAKDARRPLDASSEGNKPRVMRW